MCTGAATVSGSTTFQRTCRRCQRRSLESFGAELEQVQHGSGEGSKEAMGGFGAKPGQVQQGSGKGSGEGSKKPWCKAKSGSTVPEKVPEKVVQALVQSQVKFNRVSENVPVKVPAKVPGGFGAVPGEV